MIKYSINTVATNLLNVVPTNVTKVNKQQHKWTTNNNREGQFFSFFITFFGKQRMPIHSIYFNFLISFSKQFNACAHNKTTKKAMKRKKKGYIWSPQTHHDISFTNTTTDVVPKASNKHFMDRICHIRLTHVTKLQNSTSQVLIKPTFSYYVQ